MVGAMSLQSCKKDKDEDTTTVDYEVHSTSSTMVSSFGLKANSKILNNLDSVKFTIDQDRGVIYNADSLPKGTRVSAMLVTMSTASNVSSREIIVKNATEQSDTSFIYSSTKSDSIDFTGDVTLRITSYDKLHTRDYKVKVNVHKMKVDTIMWNASRRRDLPNVSSTLLASKTTRQEATFMCLVNDNGSYVLSTSTDPIAGTWTKKVLSLPFTPQVKSFVATGDALFMLDNNGQLFTSSDNGSNWTDCGVAWHSLIGAYGDKVMGVFNDAGTWKHDEYPRANGFVPTAIEDGFPVEDMSQLAMAYNEWTSNQQAMTVGGLKADGTFSSQVWGYDGNQWAPISTGTVLPPMCNAVMLPYYTMDQANSVTWKKRITWLILGGQLNTGALNTTTYISYNQGINWSKGSSSVQLPAHVPAFYGAQAFAFERYISSSPALMSYNPGQVTPIVNWDCPYLYIFGGYGANNTALNNVWEGVLTGLTFKPVF